LENIIQSSARFTALGKYLTALTTSFENGARLDPASKREPSIKRKRLHILYLVNDILYHAKYRVNDASICGKLQPILVKLLGSAASFTKCPKHHRKIDNLLKIWEEKGYYSKDYVEKLRETVKNASAAGNYEDTTMRDGVQGHALKITRSTPYVMPASHGDPSTPWYDLPAGNLMPHIVPNSTRPINPAMIKPLQFVAGPADEGLATAVKNLLNDVQTIFGAEIDQDDQLERDIDELGQPIVLDEVTGDVMEGEGYYGWSQKFCEKMKRRRKGHDVPDQDGDRGRSRSRSSSRSRKRRRDSDSDGSSSVGYRASRPRRAYSSSRSPLSDDGRALKNGHSRSRSRNRSYSRSPRRSPDRSMQLPGLPAKPPPPPPPPFSQAPFQHGFNGNYPPPPPPPNIPFIGLAQQQYGAWPGPPPFQNAPWPPPPPPPAPANLQPSPGGYPPPPPPGPGGWQGQIQHGSGRGYNNNGWNSGRGSRGNYRGRGWSA
jgi:hypothetical protein